MTWPANKLKTAAFAVATVLALPNGAPAQTTPEYCDTRSGWVDYEAKGFSSEADMYSDCVERGHGLAGRLSENILRRLRSMSGRAIGLRPYMQDEWLDLTPVATGCLSRAYFDAICLRNTSLFSSPYEGLNGCRLPGIYNPSENDLVNVAIQQWMRMRRGTCTTYSSQVIVGPLEIGPGVVDRVRLGSVDGAPLVTSSISLHSLQTNFLDLENLLISGNLIGHALDAEYLSLTNVVVLGNLSIDGGELTNIRLQSVWVGGDVVVKGIKLESAILHAIKVGGTLSWWKNVARDGELNHYDVTDLDLRKPPDIQQNTTTGAILENREIYTDFLGRLLLHYEASMRLVAEGSGTTTSERSATRP